MIIIIFVYFYLYRGSQGGLGEVGEEASRSPCHRTTRMKQEHTIADINTDRRRGDGMGEEVARCVCGRAMINCLSMY